MSLLKKLLVATIAISSVSCSNSDDWEGFVYPNRDNLNIHTNIGSYTSLENCRSAALSTLARISSIEKGDYECGLNCEVREGMGGIKVCEKTER